MSISIETFFLDPSTEGTLQSRIQRMVAQGILDGRFRPGERLPSSRKMAQHLGVSRITVTLAYTELVADDYLTAKGRSGYFVSAEAPDPPAFPANRSSQGTVDWSRIIGGRSTPNLGLEKPIDWAQYPYPFIYGQTDPTLFDSSNWRLCALQALGKRDFASLTADQFDADDPNLVEFIARQSLPRRGILAATEEILVTMGAQNALWLATQVLLTQRRTATIEDPCYPALRSILFQSRCLVEHVPVDQDGLPPSLIPDQTDVVFTTPSHQSPTTSTMPLERRRALLKDAEERDYIIVEDDYEFEMAFGSSPMPSLKSLDENGRVIYVGSYSKSLFPGLRLGYMVGPAPFIREARALRSAVLRHPPGHVQRTVSHYLSLGHFDALVRRVSRAYQQRRATLIKALEDNRLPLPAVKAGGGSSLWLQAPSGVDTVELTKLLRTRGVLIEPGAPFFATAPTEKSFYRLAYSSIPATKIPEGVSRIAQAMSELRNTKASIIDKFKK